MCGIAGIYSPKGIIEYGVLRSMSENLKHRGPDGYGYLLYSKSADTRVWYNQEVSGSIKKGNIIGFAHRRLSVIDLSEGSIQPMIDEMSGNSVVYNGEIYNYLELRTELEKLGYHFKTTGDVEVLLKAYHAWGPECMLRFNGMWAFALLDISNQRIILSRDRHCIMQLKIRCCISPLSSRVCLQLTTWIVLQMKGLSLNF